MPVPLPVIVLSVIVAVAWLMTWIAVIEPMILLLLTESVPPALKRLVPELPAVLPLTAQLFSVAKP